MPLTSADGIAQKIRRVAVCCSVLQCVAVCCSVLQCGETSADGIAVEDETTSARISQKSVLQSYRIVN